MGSPWHWIWGPPQAPRGGGGEAAIWGNSKWLCRHFRTLPVSAGCPAPHHITGQRTAHTGAWGQEGRGYCAQMHVHMPSPAGRCVQHRHGGEVLDPADHCCLLPAASPWAHDRVRVCFLKEARRARSTTERVPGSGRALRVHGHRAVRSHEVVGSGQDTRPSTRWLSFACWHAG